MTYIPSTPKQFNIQWYLTRYPDVAQYITAHSLSNDWAWEHYVTYGIWEKREVLPFPDEAMFCADKYLIAYHDVAASPLYKDNPLQHFKDWGFAEGRNACPEVAPPQPEPQPPMAREYLCGWGDPENLFYRSDRWQILDQIITYGGNVIYLIVSCAHDGDTPDGNPFEGGNPNQGLSPSRATDIKAFVEKMNAHGIWAYLFLYDDSSQPFGSHDIVTSAEDQYIHQLVNLLGHIPRLIWCIGEEYSEAMNRARASEIAKRLNAYDVGRHKIAIHQHSGTSFDFGDDKYIKEFCVQLIDADKNTLHTAMVNAVHEARGRYSIMLGESTEPGSSFEAYGMGGTMMRKNWACAMAGVDVMVYTRGRWGEDAGMENLDFKYLRNQHTFLNMIPDYRQMVNMDYLKTGCTDYVMKNPTADSWLLLTSKTGALGAEGFSAGIYTISWFDCQTGAGVNEANTITQGQNLFIRPSGIGIDTVCYVRT